MKEMRVLREIQEDIPLSEDLGIESLIVKIKTQHKNNPKHNRWAGKQN